MASKKSPINNTNIELELEAIRRFRGLVPFLNPECRVSRQLKGHSTVLCLDFTACPQDLNLNKKDWREFTQLLILSSRYLGLANSLMFKVGKGIISEISFT